MQFHGKKFVSIGAFSVLFIGVCVALGWHFNFPNVKALLPSFITMKFNAALALIFFAVAQISLCIKNWPHFKIVSAIGASFGFLIGALTALQYLLNINLGVDEFFYLDLEGVGKLYPPGRLAPVTAFSFILMGLAIYFAFLKKPRRYYHISQIFLSVIILLSFQALVAYALGVDTSFGFAAHSRIALHSAFGLIVLSVGFLALTHSRGYMPMILSSSLSGRSARRLIAAAVVAPPFFSFLERAGQHYEIFDQDFGVLLRVIGGVVFFVLIAWKNTEKLHTEERIRRKTQNASQYNEQKSLQFLTEKTLSQAIQKSEAHLRAIFNSAFIGIISFNRKGEITEWNPSAKNIFRWKREDVLGRNGLDVIFPLDQNESYHDKILALLEATSYTEQSPSIEIMGKRKNNELFPMRLSACLVMVEGDIHSTLFIEDLSEIKKKEKELIEKRQQALHANKVKSDFLANMSHEIRTPLNGIIGMTKLLGKTKLNEVQADFVETIELSSNVLLTLINQILDLSKIEAGKIELSETHFELKSLLKSTIPIVSFAAENKGLSLRVQIQPNETQFYIGDPFRIQQILLNLLNNSVKFSEKGEILLKVTKKDEIDSVSTLLFEIIDQGIGMLPSEKEKLFQPFSQGDRDISRDYGGTGLGLFISKQLVEMMDGTIDVESVKHLGSRFFFEIKLKNSKELYMSSTHSHQTTKKEIVKNIEKLSGYVLIAEDNKVNQKVIAQMVEILGCKIKIVETGFQVLEVLQQEHFDLILMDGQMPGMDGCEVARRIRNLEAGEQNVTIPIIAVSANAIQGDAQNFLESGMNDFVSKPILFDDFAYKLKKWISRGRDVIEKSALQNLREISQAGNKNLLEDLVILFKHETPSAINILRTQIREGNLKAAARTAHIIKSSCANLGAFKMQELSEKIEKQKGEPSTQQLVSLAENLEQEFHATCEALHKHLVS